MNKSGTLDSKQKILFCSLRVAEIYPKFLPTGSALEDLNLDEPLNIAASLDRELEVESNSISNSISTGLANSGKG